MADNSFDPVKRWQQAEMLALEMLLRLTKEGKKTLTKKDKREIVDILIHYGMPRGLLILIIHGMDASAGKLGRAIDVVKRNWIRNYFIDLGRLPAIRPDGQKGRRKKDDPDHAVIAECAKKLDKKLSPSVENSRNLITKLLQDSAFRQEVEEEIRTPLSKLFVSHMEASLKEKTTRK